MHFPKNQPGAQVTGGDLEIQKNPAKNRVKPLYRKVQWFLGLYMNGLNLWYNTPKV